MTATAKDTLILPTEMLARVHRLWDELSGFGATRMEEALLYVLRELAELVGAQQAFWLGYERTSDRHDALNGWRSSRFRYLHPRPAQDKRYATQMKLLNGSQLPATATGISQFRIDIQNESRSSEWYQSEWYRTSIAPFRIHDVIYMAMPVGTCAESWFGFQRIGDDKASYTPYDRAVMEYAGRALNWFHRLVCLHHGIGFADSPLTPAEQRLVGFLLAGGTESDIAHALKLSPTTVHTYATRIYRKFNVQGRTGLMALWLGFRK